MVAVLQQWLMRQWNTPLPASELSQYKSYQGGCGSIPTPGDYRLHHTNTHINSNATSPHLLIKSLWIRGSVKCLDKSKEGLKVAELCFFSIFQHHGSSTSTGLHIWSILKSSQLDDEAPAETIDKGATSVSDKEQQLAEPVWLWRRGINDYQIFYFSFS